MPVLFVTYAPVSAGQEVGLLASESVSTETARYLEEHVAALDGRIRTSAPARFSSPHGKGRYEALLSGVDDEFLSAAREVAVRLVAGMSGRTSDGLFLAMRIADTNGEVRAAVLKLQATHEPRGYLKRIGNRVTLDTIRDALDTPGELQKGGLYPDPRSNSDVLVGDKLDKNALYFLHCVDVVQEQKPKDAVLEVFDALARRAPGQKEAIARSLASRGPESLNDLLEVVHVDVPELHPHLRDVRAELSARPRPVVSLDAPAATALRREIKGGGITISGPVAEMERRVESAARDDGRWEVRVTLDVKPTDEVRK